MEGLKNMKNKKIKLNKSGFTLIELIVSVTIIAVMTVVAAVSFTGVGRKSRDARRISDLQKIAIALEMIKQQGGGSTYPATSGSLVTGGFLPFWPVGPKGVSNSDNYIYTPTSNYTYRLCAFVENTDSISSDVLGCSGLPSGYAGYYKVVNP